MSPHLILKRQPSNLVYEEFFKLLSSLLLLYVFRHQIVERQGTPHMLDVSTLASGSAQHDDRLNKGGKPQRAFIAQLSHADHLAALPKLRPYLADHLVLVRVDHDQSHLLAVPTAFAHLCLLVRPKAPQEVPFVEREFVFAMLFLVGLIALLLVLLYSLFPLGNLLLLSVYLLMNVPIHRVNVLVDKIDVHISLLTPSPIELKLSDLRVYQCDLSLDIDSFLDSPLDHGLELAAHVAR